MERGLTLAHQRQGGGRVAGVGVDLQHVPEFTRHVEPSAEGGQVPLVPLAGAELHVVIVVIEIGVEADVHKGLGSPRDVGLGAEGAAVADVGPLAETDNATVVGMKGHIAELLYLVGVGAEVARQPHAAPAFVHRPAALEVVGVAETQVGVAEFVVLHAQPCVGAPQFAAGRSEAAGVTKGKVVPVLGGIAGVERGDEVPESLVNVILRGLHRQVGEGGLFPFAIDADTALERKALDFLLHGDVCVQLVVHHSGTESAVGIVRPLAGGKVHRVPLHKLRVAPQHGTHTRLHRGVLAERLGIVDVDVCPPRRVTLGAEVAHIVLRHYGIEAFLVAFGTLVIVVTVYRKANLLPECVKLPREIYAAEAAHPRLVNKVVG